MWVARDYPNSDTIWRKEILRRFANKPGFKINKQDKRVEFEMNGGSLTICSADNIDSVRGGNWDGVIIDEAAHIDLDTVWSEVIRPGLADTKGWAIIMSTTYTGSYFNELCELVMTGQRGKGWDHSHLTARSNPKIDPDEIEEMCAEYEDEVKLKQEVEAELVVPGGFAFPEWDSSVHVQKEEPPLEWNWVGCMDWNYVQPGWFGLAAVQGGRMFFRWEHKFQKSEPFDVGYRIGMVMRSRFQRPMYIVADSQMFATTQGTVTMAAEVQAGLAKAYGGDGPALIPGPKGPQSRIQSKVLIHQLLKFERNKDGTVSQWKAPRLTFHPDCAWAITSLPKLTRDPHNPEDILNVPTLACAYDGIRYLAMMHAPGDWRTEKKEQKTDRHPGFSEGIRRKWGQEEEPEPSSRYVRS